MINTEELKKIVLKSIDLTKEIDNKELHRVIDGVIEEDSQYKYISVQNRSDIHKKIFDSIRGFGVIEGALEDREVTEIMINGKDNIFVEKKGRIYKLKEKFGSENELNNMIQQIVGNTNRRVNETNPIVDTRLPDGSRVNVILPPVALDGAIVTIRKFSKNIITMDEMVNMGTITEDAANFMNKLVKAGYNIFISGGTGSGKTTFLNVLSNFIPEDERVITIEDSAELNLKSVDNIVRMETRQANTEGQNQITIRDLIKTSLRARPDRIIVGEVRGVETLDMLQAMNTGHDGSMSTGHANSLRDMLNRLETMVLMGIEMPLQAIRAQIVGGIDIMVHLGRMRDKSRKVLEIDEVLGMEKGEIVLNPLYVFEEDIKDKYEQIVRGQLIRTNNELKNTEKMKRKGFEQWMKN